MRTSEPFLLNPCRREETAASPAATSAETARVEEVRSFHRGLPGYASTPLVLLPSLAAGLDLGAVLVKDESLRLGLPAFKMLGASWAVHRALTELAHSGRPRLVTATDGNHGRAVARTAAIRGLPATVVVPREIPDRAVSLIRAEGADVRALDAPYDEAVRHAAALADEDPNVLLIQDTSWPGYEDVPEWITEGYATLFHEAAEQAAELGLSLDLVVVPAGVGSLAHAAVRFARSRQRAKVVTVEPTVAACVRASLAAGALTTVATGETSMAGLNCGTPSYLAWPELRRSLVGAVAVDDETVEVAMSDLAELGVDSGPCGAASLAALRILAAPPPRDTLDLGPTSTVLLLNTESRGAGE